MTSDPAAIGTSAELNTGIVISLIPALCEALASSSLEQTELTSEGTNKVPRS